MMKAAWYESFGSAEKVLHIGQRPAPEAGPGEVLVRLKTSGVNPSDVKKRAGAAPDLLADGYVIPHSDGAGIIEAVGNGVDPGRIGERVFVYQAQYERQWGTAAEYVAIDSRRAVKLPGNTSFEIGACIGIPILTAHRCVFADGGVAGKTLLVTGGGGRVGYYAIQWARQSGARVIATIGSTTDEESCREIGVDHVVNHHEQDWGAQVLSFTEGRKVDRVVDVEFGANLSQTLDIIKTGGTIATYSSTRIMEPSLPFYQMMFKDLTVRMVLVYAMPEEAKGQAVGDTVELLGKNVLQHRIAHVLPFHELVKSHELIERGNLHGCVVVKIDD
jgi:NADPH:quinone reductase-like Zn-dependent oxidoreductase